jgi:hypothetical protein
LRRLRASGACTWHYCLANDEQDTAVTNDTST